MDVVRDERRDVAGWVGLWGILIVPNDQSLIA